MKIFLFIFLLFPIFCYAQTDEDLVKRIDQDVAAIDERHKETKREFVLKRKVGKRKTVSEQWTYSTLKGELEFFSILRREGKNEWSESYYLKKGALFFAHESDADYFTDGSGELSTIWGARHYFDDGKFIESRAYGVTGKSEGDDWNPEKETQTRFETRLKQLRLKIKTLK